MSGKETVICVEVSDLGIICISLRIVKFFAWIFVGKLCNQVAALTFFIFIFPLIIAWHSTFAGVKQELLAHNRELLGSQPGSESETEFDVALSDFASPRTVGEMDKKLPTRTPNSRDLKESTNWELDYVKMVLKDSELKLMEYASGQTDNIMTPNGFDQLEHRNITETQGEEHKKLEQKLVADCVSEYLELRCGQVVVGSCKGWVKWGKWMQNKGRLAEEVCKEIMSLKQMGDVMVDEAVDMDMSRQHGRWVEFEMEAFEEGLDIEKTVLTCLVDELVSDLLL